MNETSTFNTVNIVDSRLFNCSSLYEPFFNATSNETAYHRIKCITRVQLFPERSFTVKFSHQYFFPLVFLMGVVGNGLNLAVLNSKGMTSKTNVFLSAMATSDLLMLIALSPINLDQFDSFWTIEYAKFYFHAHIPLIAFVNWFSAASIWLSVGVTLERTVAVKFPIHARLFWKKSRVVGSIVSIYVLTFFLNSLFHFFRRTVVRVPVCGECGVYTYYWRSVDPLKTPLEYRFSEIAIIASAILTIATPFAVLTILNVILVHDLRRNSRFMTASRDDRRSQNSAHRAKANERKVTYMVVVIILSFMVLNTPSAVMYILEVADGFKRQPRWFYEAAEVGNMLVLLSKSLNFVLYCLSSANFRKHLLRLMFREDGCASKAMRKSRLLASSIQRAFDSEANSEQPTNLFDLSDHINGASFSQQPLLRRHSTFRPVQRGKAARSGSLDVTGLCEPKPVSSCSSHQFKHVIETSCSSSGPALRKRVSLLDGVPSGNGSHHPFSPRQQARHLMSPKQFNSLSDFSLKDALLLEPQQPSVEILQKNNPKTWSSCENRFSSPAAAKNGTTATAYLKVPTVLRLKCPRKHQVSWHRICVSGEETPTGDDTPL